MSTLTRKEVDRRIRNHEPLPDSVLVDYPEIARKYKIVKANPSDLKTEIKKLKPRSISRYHKNAKGDLIKENSRAFRDMKNFTSERLEPPSHFDKRSFRTIVQSDGTEIVIGCPKGKYDAKTGRCKVGTRAQAIRKPKREKKDNPRHGNIQALRRGLAKHSKESYEDFKARMLKKHGKIPDAKIRQWYNLKNAGMKALGIK